MTFAVIDFDAIKYAAAAAGEKRTIKVIHKASGREMDFANRTAFYGVGKKGGWLAERNEGRTSPFLVDDFLIQDVQHPEPVGNVLHVARSMTDSWLKLAGATGHVGFIGKGDSWRVERSTILKYKGQRTDLLRPVHLDAVADYLVNTFNVRIVQGLEADDWCVIEALQHTDSVVLAIDKDARGTPCNVLNPNRLQDGVINGDCFGALYMDGSKVRGHGRLYLYHQICSGDKIDNYKANSASHLKWGEVKSYQALVGCKDDQEAWAAMVKVYQTLYPEPRVVTGWRGDEILVDWKYMLEENFQMARMLTTPDEQITAEGILIERGFL